MATRDSKRITIIFLFLTLFSLVGPGICAADEVLDLFVGHWNVRVKTLKPVEAETAYTEKYEWVLNGQFLAGRTQNKADGTEDIIYGTYDPKFKGYPFWIFSSSGTYLYLAPGTWDASRRALEWRNPANSDISYRTEVVFTDDKTRRWTVVIKDWKGTVILRQEGVAVRSDE